MTTESLPTSFLRWAGSKKQLLSILKTYWQPTFRRYIEPFAGSSCLFFSLRPKKALLGDLNEELITTYTQLKENPRSIVRALKQLRKSKTRYYSLRNLNPEALQPAKRVARFIYLNRFCFNGIYRTNLEGNFNVPYGGNGTGSLPGEGLLRVCSKELRKATLVSGDFESTVARAKKGDFVYMDPPFFVLRRRIFAEYGEKTFTNADLKRLRKTMKNLDKKGVHFLVSYAASKEAGYLKRGFFSKTVVVRRNVAGFAANRRKAREILISNFSPTPAGE